MVHVRRPAIAVRGGARDSDPVRGRLSFVTAAGVTVGETGAAVSVRR